MHLVWRRVGADLSLSGVAQDKREDRNPRRADEEKAGANYFS